MALILSELARSPRVHFSSGEEGSVALNQHVCGEYLKRLRPFYNRSLDDAEKASFNELLQPLIDSNIIDRVCAERNDSESLRFFSAYLPYFIQRWLVQEGLARSQQDFVYAASIVELEVPDRTSAAVRYDDLVQENSFHQAISQARYSLLDSRVINIDIAFQAAHQTLASLDLIGDRLVTVHDYRTPFGSGSLNELCDKEDTVILPFSFQRVSSRSASAICYGALTESMIPFVNYLLNLRRLLAREAVIPAVWREQAGVLANTHPALLRPEYLVRLDGIDPSHLTDDPMRAIFQFLEKSCRLSGDIDWLLSVWIPGCIAERIPIEKLIDLPAMMITALSSLEFFEEYSLILRNDSLMKSFSVLVQWNTSASLLQVYEFVRDCEHYPEPLSAFVLSINTHLSGSHDSRVIERCKQFLTQYLFNGPLLFQEREFSKSLGFIEPVITLIKNSATWADDDSRLLCLKNIPKLTAVCGVLTDAWRQRGVEFLLRQADPLFLEGRNLADLIRICPGPESFTVRAMQEMNQFLKNTREIAGVRDAALVQDAMRIAMHYIERCLTVESHDSMAGAGGLSLRVESFPFVVHPWFDLWALCCELTRERETDLLGCTDRMRASRLPSSSPFMVRFFSRSVVREAEYDIRVDEASVRQKLNAMIDLVIIFVEEKVAMPEVRRSDLEEFLKKTSENLENYPVFSTSLISIISVLLLDPAVRSVEVLEKLAAYRENLDSHGRELSREAMSSPLSRG